MSFKFLVPLIRVSIIVIDADGGTSCNQPSNTHVTSSRKRKGALDSYFPSGTTPGSQPTIKSVLQSKEKLHEVDFAIAL